MRVSITRTEIVEVEPNDGVGTIPFDLEEFRDSIQDDILNRQENGHETDDEKFSYTPKELSALVVETVGEETETAGSDAVQPSEDPPDAG
jgi:hypothetical protein